MTVGARRIKNTRRTWHTDSTKQGSQQFTETQMEITECMGLHEVLCIYVVVVQLGGLCGAPNSGSTGISDIFCPFLGPFSSFPVATYSLYMRVCAQSYCLYLMSCLVAMPWRPTFCVEGNIEAVDLGDKRRVAGRSEGMGGCSGDVVYERRKKKKKK